MNTELVRQCVQARKKAFDLVIAELRAMGLDDIFITKFLDEGRADSIVKEVIRRDRRRA